MFAGTPTVPRTPNMMTGTKHRLDMDYCIEPAVLLSTYQCFGKTTSMALEVSIKCMHISCALHITRGERVKSWTRLIPSPRKPLDATEAWKTRGKTSLYFTAQSMSSGYSITPLARSIRRGTEESSCLFGKTMKVLMHSKSYRYCISCPSGPPVFSDKTFPVLGSFLINGYWHSGL
jgi:hypothetical protein